MEALKQRILEHIADLLDEPTFDMDMRLKGLKDPLPSDKSELHLLMTDAAFKALCTYFNKQDQTEQCTINSVVGSAEWIEQLHKKTKKIMEKPSGEKVNL